MFSLSALTKTANYSKCDGFSSILDLKVMGAFIICEVHVNVGRIGGQWRCFLCKPEKSESKEKEPKDNDGERAEHPPLSAWSRRTEQTATRRHREGEGPTIVLRARMVPGLHLLL